jgi:hypothetical protein
MEMAKNSNPQIGTWYTRPFKREDLNPIPEDWIVKGPHYVGISSPKAGTSWWNRMILEHPQVKHHRLNRKELSYFCHFGPKGMDADSIKTYRSAFAAPVGCISGEWTPIYLNFPMALEYLASAVPEVKLLAIVRNPIDRFLSSLNQLLSLRFKYMNLKDDRAYIYKNFSLFPEAIHYSLLYQSFSKLLKLFKRSQLLLLQFEKCKADPRNEILKTYRFLELEESFRPPSLYSPVNVRDYILPPLTSQERIYLKNFFWEDVKAFNHLFPEIDLSLWKDFNA